MDATTEIIMKERCALFTRTSRTVVDVERRAFFWIHSMSIIDVRFSSQVRLWLNLISVGTTTS